MRRSDRHRPQILYLLTDEGSAVLVRGQLGFLVGEGFDVTVATRLAMPGVPKAGAWDDGIVVEHVPFVREPSPLADIRALSATVRLIRRQRPDVVNASTPKAGLLGMLSAWACRVPVRVYVVRGFRFETASGLRRRLLVGLEKLALRSANHVVFNSASLMALGEREGVIRPGRGEVIGHGSGNGIDVSRFAEERLPSRAEARAQFGVPDDPGTFVVGFVGRFTHDKGIADLVHVGESLRAERPGLHVLLVGQFEEGDPVPPDVRSAIECVDHVTVVPWLDHTGIAYRAMDVLAFPSYREGLPNVPLEAQICGVPVVAYGATGTIDAVRNGETGVLVPTGNELALAGAISALLEDEPLRARFAANGRLWVADAFDRRELWRAWLGRYQDWTAGNAVSASPVDTPAQR